MLPSLLVSSLIGLGAAVASGYEIRLSNASDLLNFASEVNQGALHGGATVVLDSDIDFSGELSQQFEPIGKNLTNYFTGTFNGQGHAIRNLTMTTSSKYAGLFGYSKGVVIKNLVIDSSCSFTSTSNFTSAYIGGVIGECYANDDNCTFENSVNMGSATFSGNFDDERVYVGGIAGYAHTSFKGSYIKNCANYGSIVSNGASYSLHLGGIFGYSQKIRVQNCLNYGSLSNEGKTKFLYIGGISGYNSNEKVENCVSAGRITSSTESGSIGSIIGYDYYLSISHCYWSESIPFNPISTFNSTSDNSSTSFNENFVLKEAVTVEGYTGKSLLDALNTYVDKYRFAEYSYWLTNKNSNAVTFLVNGNEKFSLNSQVILLPDLVNKEEVMFDGWYTDSECTSQLETFSISEQTSLYARFGESNKTSTITFDSRGGSPVEPIEAQYYERVELPRDLTKKGYAFLFWENAFEEKASWDFAMTSHNITLHAVWGPVHISTAEEFVEFSRIVNSGRADYNGTTVYLDSDIVFTPELSEQFEPIGDYYSDSYFSGTFDGQRHAIKGLAKTTYKGYMGLFGYSSGLTIRNVVVDESCTMTVSYDTYHSYDCVYNGGIIGKCVSSNGPCIVENCVNKMNIAYDGDAQPYFYIGGIAGQISGDKFEAKVTNCTNYGKIDCNLIHGYYSVHVGGILGGASEMCLHKNLTEVQNCANYGDIKGKSKSKDCYLYADGILGSEKCSNSLDCENYGKVTNLVKRKQNAITAGLVVVSVFAALAAVVFVVAFISLTK